MIGHHLASEGHRFFCHNVAVKIRGLTLREMDSLCDPVIQETVFVRQGHSDVVACPAEVDTLTEKGRRRHKRCHWDSLNSRFTRKT